MVIHIIKNKNMKIKKVLIYFRLFIIYLILILALALALYIPSPSQVDNIDKRLESQIDDLRAIKFCTLNSIGCSPKTAEMAEIHQIKLSRDQLGVASWYDYELDGINWSKTHRTCASRDFERYTYLKVTNLSNGKSVICYVNDYIENPERVIDLSSYAFSQIGELKLGLLNVKIENYGGK